MVFWYRRFEPVVQALFTQGWFVAEAFWPDSAIAQLEQIVAGAAGEPGSRFHAAGIGPSRARVPEFRTDRIAWLEPQHPLEHQYLVAMELYRTLLNRRLFLGLQEYECHYASYAPGGFYRRHLDGFRHTRSRIVTTVSFLNTGWGVRDGGELQIFNPEQPETPLVQVLPRAGTFVSFLSETFPHEVLPGRRPRHSLTGWFRLRSL